MAEFKVYMRCCKTACASKAPTLIPHIEIPSDRLSAAEAAATFEQLVPCTSGHDNIITIPLKWGRIFLSGSKIVGYHTTGGQSIPIIKGRCLE